MLILIYDRESPQMVNLERFHFWLEHADTLFMRGEDKN